MSVKERIIETNDSELTTDIIHKEHYENLIEKIKSLSDKEVKQEDFLLNISHDLRAHLNVILSVMQCIDNGNVKIIDKKALEYMKIVKRNSYKMLKLINNLIDTSKLENDYYTLNKRNVDIVAMLEGTISCIDRYAKQKNIQLIFDTNEEECIVAVDLEAIDRIVMNLISNSIKFSDNDKNIFINLLVSENDIKISVRDEGPGISKENQEQIFNRFYQVKNRKESESKGSGIGLDLVNYLTKAHNGEIKINSEEGIGTEFTVILPKIILRDNKEVDLRDESKKIQMLEIEFSDIYLN